MSIMITAKYERVDHKGQTSSSKHKIGEGLLKETSRALEETVIEAFTRVVANTPIKKGTLISGWKVYVGEDTELKLIDYANMTENTTVSWSRQKAFELSESFRQALRSHVQGSMPVMRYKIENTVYHAEMIEGGTYIGHVYDYIIRPYYIQPTPFELTSGGWSLKATGGMVKIVAIEVADIFKQKMNGVQNGI